MVEQSIKKEPLLNDLQEKLNTEKWTKTGLDTYSVRNFVELDALIESARNNDCLDDIRQMAREHLKDSIQSVIALYIVGSISLQQSAMDDSYLPQLIKMFLEHNKIKVVEFLCEKILSYREHKYALRTLEQIYTNQDEKEALFNIRKRLVLVDSADAANAKLLGEFYEDEDKDLAMFYYRLAIERFIRMRNLKMIEELWNRVIMLYPEDTKLVITIAKKIREAASDEYVAALAFNTVAKNMMREGKFKQVLPLVKFCVALHPSEKQYRKAIEDCYREIYKDHHQLEHYLKASNVGQSWKPYREAIRFFESHIAFDTGSFVHHKNWGIGEVKLIEKDKVIISFAGKKDHEMSLMIALRSLTVLDEDHILLWKNQKPIELRHMLDQDPLKVIELIMRSNDVEAINSKDLKEIIVPDLLSDKEWARWWLRAKKMMEFSNTIVPSLAKRNVIELRDTERSVVEELVSRFKKTTSFENKVVFCLNFIERGGDINEESAAALKNYFLEVLNVHSESAERKVISLALLKLAKTETLDENLIDIGILNGIKNFSDFYSSLGTELQKIVLRLLQRKDDWAYRYKDLILGTQLTKNHSFMLQELVSHDKWEDINHIFSFALTHFQEKPELFVWISRHALDDMKEEFAHNVKEDELILRMVTLIDILNSEIGVKTAVGRNKKLLTQIEDSLFKKQLLNKVINDADESTAQSLFALISSTITFDKEQKDTFLKALNNRYPKLETARPSAAMITARYPFLVTKQSYENKRKDLEHLINVEIPQNSLAIGEAMEKGDLRENSEYKAALEKQDQLKANLAKLESDLAQARVLDRSKVDTSFVDVGTKVTLEEKNDGIVSFQILDQWAVNFDKGIISYHSPLGHALLDKKVGDVVVFEFNGEVKNFTVLSIELADFE